VACDKKQQAAEFHNGGGVNSANKRVCRAVAKAISRQIVRPSNQRAAWLLRFGVILVSLALCTGADFGSSEVLMSMTDANFQAVYDHYVPTKSSPILPLISEHKIDVSEASEIEFLGRYLSGGCDIFLSYLQWTIGTTPHVIWHVVKLFAGAMAFLWAKKHFLQVVTLVTLALISLWGLFYAVVVSIKSTIRTYKWFRSDAYNAWWTLNSIPFWIWNSLVGPSYKLKVQPQVEGVTAQIDGENVVIWCGSRKVQTFKISGVTATKEMAFTESPAPTRMINANDPRFRSQVTFYRLNGTEMCFLGTGTFSSIIGRTDGVTRNLIWTCAHVADQATHFSAANSHERPQQKYVKLPEVWMKSGYVENNDTDVAIYLVTPSDISRAGGYMLPTLASLKSCDQQRKIFITDGDDLFSQGPGNPVTKESGYWMNSGPVVDSPCDNECVGGHKVNTTKGWSGSGMFINKAGTWYFAGIHTGSLGSSNTMVIVEEVLEDVQRFLKSELEVADKEAAEGSGVNKSRKFGGNEGRSSREARDTRSDRAKYIAGTSQGRGYKECMNIPSEILPVAEEPKPAEVPKPSVHPLQKAIQKESADLQAMGLQLASLLKLKAERTAEISLAKQANSQLPKVNEDFQPPPMSPTEGRAPAAAISLEKPTTNTQTKKSKAKATAPAVVAPEITSTSPENAQTNALSTSSTKPSQVSQKSSTCPILANPSSLNQSTSTTTGTSTPESGWTEKTSKNAAKRLVIATKLLELTGISVSEASKLSTRTLKGLMKIASVKSTSPAVQVTPTDSSPKTTKDSLNNMVMKSNDSPSKESLVYCSGMIASMLALHAQANGSVVV
jgi:hypothetical protein